MSEVRKYRRPKGIRWCCPAHRPDPLPDWAYEHTEQYVGPPTYEVRTLRGRVTAEALDQHLALSGWERIA